MFLSTFIEMCVDEKSQKKFKCATIVLSYEPVNLIIARKGERRSDGSYEHAGKRKISIRS